MRKKLFALSITAGFLLTAGSLTANAVDLRLNGSFAVSKADNNTVYIYKPNANGTIQIQSSSSLFFTNFFFSDEACTEVVADIAHYHTISGGFVYYFPAEKGKTYYFCLKNNALEYEYAFTTSLNSKTDAPHPTFIYPERGREEFPVYHLSNAPELQLIFNNKAVTFDNAIMHYETNDGEMKSAEMDIFYVEYDNSWRVFVRNVVEHVKSEMKNGSIILLELTNMQANGVRPDGEFAQGDNLVIPYTYISQTIAINAKWPNPFLTYWTPGDEEGIAVITYNGDLKPMEEQKDMDYKLYAGSDIESEDGMQLMPTPKMTIEGNVITIDFTGVLYETDKEEMSMIISNVVDIYDMPMVYAGNNGIFQIMPLKKLDPINVAFELTPASEGTLKDVEEVELWISNEAWGHMIIEGFVWKYDDKETAVAFTDCRREADPFYPDDYTLIYIPVPEEARSASEVLLDSDITTMDGYPYSISAAYLNAPEDTDGVASITDEAKVLTVYNLQGMKIMTTDNRDDLRKLPEGMYVVNGKLEIKN